MRRTSATHLVAPTESAIVLAALRCMGCGDPEVTAWVEQIGPNGAHQTCLCVECWRKKIVPAMKSERTEPMAGRRSKANGHTVPMPSSDYRDTSELADGGADDEANAAIGAQVAADAAAEKFATDTLTGDLRDFVLARLKHEQDKRPWHERSEYQQRETINAVEAAVRSAVTKAVDLIAGHGRSAIKASLTQIVVKDAIKGIIELSKHDPLRHALMDAQGATVLIILADPETFTGERAPVPVTPDQGDIVDKLSVVHSNPLN